jgi:hypothetical protein
MYVVCTLMVAENLADHVLTLLFNALIYVFFLNVDLNTVSIIILFHIILLFIAINL